MRTSDSFPIPITICHGLFLGMSVVEAVATNTMLHIVFARHGLRHVCVCVLICRQVAATAGRARPAAAGVQDDAAAGAAGLARPPAHPPAAQLQVAPSCLLSSIAELVANVSCILHTRGLTRVNYQPKPPPPVVALCCSDAAVVLGVTQCLVMHSGATDEYPELLQYTCRLRTNVRLTRTATLEVRRPHLSCRRAAAPRSWRLMGRLAWDACPHSRLLRMWVLHHRTWCAASFDAPHVRRWGRRPAAWRRCRQFWAGSR